MLRPPDPERLVGEYGTQAQTWLQQLPRQAERLSQQWQLQALRPLPGSITGAVFAARSSRGPVVLKLGLDAQQLEREAAALQAWANTGLVPELLQQSSGAYLMRQVEPGSHWDGSEEAIVELLRTLHAQPHATAVQLPRAVELLQRRLQRHRLQLDPQSPLRPQDYDLAHQLLEQDEPGPDTVLHTDLHPRSVLQGRSGPVLIDPLAACGPAAYDLAAWAGKWEASGARQRVRTGCAALGWPENYVLTLARAVALDSAWVLHHHRLQPETEVQRWLQFLRQGA